MTSISGGLSRMATLTPAAAAAAAVQHSPWHSPMPYLFGGLAAMLGLIAFALLILACSYWKLSTTLIINNSAGGGGGGDLEAAGHKLESSRKEEEEEEEEAAVFEEKVVVIMAGDVKPTFLATPISTGSPASSLFAKNVPQQQDKKSMQNINLEINIQ